MNDESTTPTEIAHGIETVAAKIGLETETSRAQKPSVLLTQPLTVISRELGALAHRSELFRQGERYITVDPATGKIRPMTAARFCSYAEKLAALVAPGGDSVRARRMGKDMAAQILACDVFRDSVRLLSHVHPVRLPVFRATEKGSRIALLPEGYDEESRIFTVETVRYDEDMDADEARAFLLDLHQDFPWQQDGDLEGSRDFAAHLAAMVGVFTSALLPAHEDRPLIVYCANQPGSGKTNLARLALAPVFGAIPAVNAGEAKSDELNKTLDAFVLERQPFILLDDLNDLRNNKLNALVTSSLQTVRVLGGSITETVETNAHIFTTGNGITFTPDLARRSLVIDLFLAAESTARKFAHTITKSWIFSESTRAKILAALWALVRNWDTMGRPTESAAHRAGFEAYSSMVGSIVMTAKFANPWSIRDSIFGGDERGEAVKELLRTLADGIESGEYSFESGDLIEKAEDLGLVDLITRGRDPARTFGHQLKTFIGREFTDHRGRLFRFGRRESRVRKSYPITILAPKSLPSPSPSLVWAIAPNYTACADREELESR